MGWFSKSDERKTVSTDEFIRLCKKHRVERVFLNLAYRVDRATMQVRTFDFSLTVPPIGAEVPAALNNVSGFDQDCVCWFDDASLPIRVPYELQDSLLEFKGSHERKGSAAERLIAFDKVVKKLEDNDIGMDIWGSNVQAIMDWFMAYVEMSRQSRNSGR
jgi:hypothetical protein